MRRKQEWFIIFTLIATLLLLHSNAQATEYTWGDGQHLWDNDYSASVNTYYGNYRDNDIWALGTNWEILGVDEGNLEIEDGVYETYCIGAVRYLTKAEGYEPGSLVAYPPGPELDPTEGWAYAYFATIKGILDCDEFLTDPDDVDNLSKRSHPSLKKSLSFHPQFINDQQERNPFNSLHAISTKIPPENLIGQEKDSHLREKRQTSPSV